MYGAILAPIGEKQGGALENEIQQKSQSGSRIACVIFQATPALLGASLILQLPMVNKKSGGSFIGTSRTAVNI
jgi:hypothetical protein